jgi:hypothetical protein
MFWPDASSFSCRIITIKMSSTVFKMKIIKECLSGGTLKHNLGCAAGKALWMASGLNLKSLRDLKRGNKVVVDGNALARKFATSGTSFSDIIQMMADLLMSLAHDSGGFIVTVIIYVR